MSSEYTLLRECNNWEHCKNGSSILGDYLISFQYNVAWWCHQMETFSVLLALSAGNSPVTGEFPAQRPVMRTFGVFFDLRLNKRLSKQSWDWWFEIPPRSLWRHCNAAISCIYMLVTINLSFRIITQLDVSMLIINTGACQLAVMLMPVHQSCAKPPAFATLCFVKMWTPQVEIPEAPSINRD